MSGLDELKLKMSAGRATHHAVRCTARKARLLPPLVVGKTVEQALAILSVGRRAGSRATAKLIRSAAAQIQGGPAEQKKAIVSKIVVNEGPKRQTFMPRAQGRATPINKKTSHVTVYLLNSSF